MPKQTLKQVIAAAIKAAGYDLELGDYVYISLPTKPLLGLDADDHDKYLDKVEKIPGLEEDSGQAEGYEFHIDLSDFTPASYRRLLALVERYQQKCKSS
jgi:hypothetical protein